MTNSNASIPTFVKKAAFIASLGGIMFGYDMGVVSGALPQLSNEFGLSARQEEMVVSTLFFGGAIGAAVGGTICDTTGRKKAIFLTDAMFVLGALVLFMAQSFTQVLIGRIIVGFAVAVSGIADVAYLHEISPTQWRGAIVSVNEACISLGFLISYVAGWGISQLNENDGWRYMFGAGSFIAIIQFMGMIFMPESPVWLREHGYLSQAKVVFELISYDDSTTHDIIPNTVPEAFPGRETVEDYGLDETHGYNTTHSRYDAVESSTLGSIQIGRVDSIDTAETEFTTDSSIDKFASSHRQLIIASFLSVGSQFCGHPNILNFAPEIFEEVGVPSLFTTVLLGVLKFTITCFVIWKIESFGRKFLLLLGMGIISVSLILLSIAFAFESEEDNMPRSKQIFAIIGIFGVAGGYACSFGPLSWLITSELFESSIRGRALGFSTIMTYLAGILVSYSFLSVQSTFGQWVPFVGYFVLTILSIFFVVFAVPDTARKDPFTIQTELMEMRFWRKVEPRLTPALGDNHEII